MSGPDNNYFLILALLIGWWFTAFFLRPFKKFSFFTVMLSKVLVGDMLRSDFLLSFFPPFFFFFFLPYSPFCTVKRQRVLSFLPSSFVLLLFLSQRHTTEDASERHDQVMQPLFPPSFLICLSRLPFAPSCCRRCFYDT